MFIKTTGFRKTSLATERLKENAGVVSLIGERLLLRQFQAHSPTMGIIDTYHLLPELDANQTAERLLKASKFLGLHPIKPGSNMYFYSPDPEHIIKCLKDDCVQVRIEKSENIRCWHLLVVAAKEYERIGAFEDAEDMHLKYEPN